MKIKIFLGLLFYLFTFFKLSAEEIKILSDNIKVLENGKIIKSVRSQAFIEEKDLYLEGEKSLYKKVSQEIILEKNVIFLDKQKKIKITAEKATYNKKNDKLHSTGSTFIKIENRYEILSKNIVYDRTLQTIFSDSETTVKDELGNVYNIENRFKLDLTKEVISTKKINIVDNKNNIYYFENAKINLIKKEILGKELKIEFIDDYFGSSKNDPILKGRSSTSNNNETKIYKAVFTTCNMVNKTCPGWEIETEEFTHDKVNKTFNYKNSWLKLFNKEIFYFPFFSHPDPTVKRKSGFLPATYGNSNNFGNWVNVPYYKALDIDKDFTFKPRLYLDDKFILQSEYRQAFENSNLITDFSYNNDGKNTNSHFFAKSKVKSKNNKIYEFQYQSVSNDEYLKLHNLSNSTEIIENESLLTSKFYFNNQIDENTNFKNNFIVYEDLSVRDSDRFRYVFPNFNFNKKIEIDKNYNGNFYFNSSGYQQQYNTNNYLAVITNDFLFNSNSFISQKGLKNNYQYLIRHDNSFSSTPLDDKDNTELYQSILFKTEYPLIKETTNYNNYLRPIIVTRFSPNNSRDLSGQDLRLTYDNIYSFNRISSSRNIEEGKSVTLGFEYNLSNKNNIDIFKFGLANSISDKKNNNLPSTSKLNQTRSDFVGKLFFKPTQVFDVNYNFSYDRDFKNSNYQAISAKFNLSNFYSRFNYLSEDNEIGNTETVSNNTSYNFNDENMIKFNTTKNLKTDFTEFYNLMYQYETDCLIASVEFKKKFYKDGSLQPEKSLLFFIRFIPFAELRPEATQLK
ncbi:LPS-assembly protein LptD [Candidatus Pelagibacter sp. RS40]|uniref:LPS-assembly protein LptD n=1 Tax=Candidatus Pelagibacter sp. RS40 TaxID=1977865 RepID=UPI000A153C50|nr:LPS-assembly protein LptD [Candidatus Pelagibacter sp. RS40]ARJ48670.1 hypothetical protein B8063_01195 [Candidatus Pelagibacter sp. RS40]